MTTTRRLSSLQGQGQGQSHQQTSLWLDSYETFKRKHIQQNKEIISKNSELNKEKADLQSQISLMRVERLSLMSSNLKLSIQLEAVRKRLERALERERDLVRERDRLKLQHRVGPAVDPQQVEVMQQALVNAIAALQAFGLALPAPTSASSPLRSSTSAKASASHLPSSPPASPPPASSDFDFEPEPSTSGGSASRRASLAERGPRQSICVSPPDLSNIDEADASDEERDDQLQRRFEPILQQLPSLVRAPSSPPRTVAPPTPSTSTATATATHAATPLARPASRGPRAPPKAPSASSHSTLGNASTTKRPARRVSGMLKPSLVVEFGEDDGGVAEEESALVGAMSRQQVDDSDDSADEELEESAVVASMPPTKSRSRRRVTSIGLDAAPTPLFASRTRVTRSTSPAAAESEEAAPIPLRQAESDSARPALRETQPKATSPSSSSCSGDPINAASTTVPPTAKEKIVERMKRRTTRVPAMATAAEVEAEAEAAQQERSSAVLASLSRGVKAGRRRVNDELDQGGEEEEDAQEQVVAGETDGQPAGAESEEPQQSDSQHESGDAREAAEAAEEEAAAGGRRARKSVNYALPKLNTKMRRPEDYVPVKPGASKPRKSSRPTSTAPRTSEVPPPVPATSATESAPAPAPIPRPASLAGKRPPPPDSLVRPAQGDDAAARGNAPNPSTSTIRQDLEARRKQRQAERDQLAKLGSSGGDLASRRPVTATI